MLGSTVQRVDSRVGWLISPLVHMVFAQIALTLHKVCLKLPFLCVWGWIEVSHLIVCHCISKVIKFQVLYSSVVPRIVANMLRLGNMVEHSIVRCGHDLHSIPHKVSIELHQQTTQGQVMWRYVALELAVVCISE